MRVDKHAFLEDDNQSILETNVTRLILSNNKVPVVVTSEPNRIVIYSWDIINNKWNYIFRTHDIIKRTFTSMFSIVDWNWSNIVGVTSINNNIFLIYKRSINNKTYLFLDKVHYDENIGSISFEFSSPVQIPIEQLNFEKSGFYLWLGNDANNANLLVLCQGIIKITSVIYDSQLVLLSVDSNLNEQNFSLSGSWKLSKIDSGGWDLDAMIENNVINIVYRRTPYWFKVSDPRINDPQINDSWDLQIHNGQIIDDALPNEEYNTLFIRRFDLQSNTIDIQNSFDNILGGAHPTIQKTNPLVITSDWIIKGKITIVPAHHIHVISPPIDLNVPIKGNLQIDSLRKNILVFDNLNWSKYKILDYDLNFLPKNIVFGDNWEESDNFVEIINNTAQIMFMNDFHRIWVTKAQLIQAPADFKGKSALQIDVLHHRINYECLILSTYLVGEDNPRDQADWILDINNKKIRILSYENGFQRDRDEIFQFDPLQQGIHEFDTTIGGCIYIDRKSPKLDFYTYTDLGDHGLRVIYDDELNDPIPIKPPKHNKGMNPAIVQGSGSNSITKVTLDISSWQETNLPNYFVSRTGRFKSIGSGIQVNLDSLFDFYLNEYNRTVLSNEDVYNMDHDAEQKLWDLYDSFQSANTVIPFHLLHSQLQFDKYQIDFFLKHNYDHDRYLLQQLPTHKTSFKGNNYLEGQGSFFYRFNFQFKSDKIETGIPLNAITFNKIKVTFSLIKEFTPVILMSEVRKVDPNTIGQIPCYELAIPIENCHDDNNPDELVHSVHYPDLPDPGSILTTKPIGKSKIDDINIKVDMSVSIVFILVLAPLMALFLASYGFGIASIISALISAIYGANAIPYPAGPIIFAVLLVLLTIVLYITVPILLKNTIKSKINNYITSDEFLKKMDDNGFMTYAGEGLAESIARKAINKINSGQNPLSWGLDSTGVDGRNRFPDQHEDFWQMIYIDGKDCTIYYKKS